MSARTAARTKKGHRTGFITIAGRPNAGKSTLLNALVGDQLAITAHQPQTTRSAIQGVLTKPGVMQMVFIDTPGIHKSDTLFNKQMMDTVRDSLAGRDLALFLADATAPERVEDEHAVSALSKETVAILVLTKIDKIEDKRSLLPVLERYSALFPFAAAIPVSSRTGDGLPELLKAIESHLPEAPPLFPEDYVTDQPLRFMAGEIIREQILRIARQEVPHAVAVLIENWEQSKKLTRIAASIYVERPGQKIILIGQGGAMLKKIGTAARRRLEELTSTKIFLSLFVKVKPAWREDAQFLREIDWRSMVGSEDK